MTNRRKHLAGCCILLLAAVLILYQVISSCPKPVLSDPETAQLIYVRIDFPEDRQGENVSWYPETPQDEEVAQAILEYLSHCQEKRIRTRKDGTHILGGSGNWPYMTIMVQLSEHHVRGILLGPSEQPEGPVQPNYSYNAYNDSILAPFTSRPWPARILQPDALRQYVLNILDLPADLL